MERVSGGCTWDRLISSSSIRSVTSANASNACRTHACTLDALQSACCKKNVTLLPSSSLSLALRFFRTQNSLRSCVNTNCARYWESHESRVTTRLRQLVKRVARRAINELEDHRASRNGGMCLIREWRDDGASTRATTKNTKRDWRGERSSPEGTTKDTTSISDAARFRDEFLTKALRPFNDDDVYGGIFYIL